jgi:hypothetical protein
MEEEEKGIGGIGDPGVPIVNMAGDSERWKTQRKKI